jgi:NAD(P)-dependent dehydrogenase (short-subunit alcohol dehydrogenase family)
MTEDCPAAVVTGGGSGIGLATVRRLVLDGLQASGPRVQAAYGGDAGARGLVGVNRGTTGEAPTIRRRP